MQNRTALENLVGFMVKSIALRQANRPEEALACLDEALSIDPTFLPALSEKGTLLCGLARYEEAIESFDRHIRLAPNVQEVIRLRNKALAEALARYQRVLEAGPDAKAFFKKGNILLRLSRWAEALESYDKALAAELSPDVLNNRGNALVELGRYEEALASYDRALEVTGDDASFWFNRGNVLQKLCLLDAAVDSYRRAVRFRPDFPEAELEQGFCLLAMGDFEKGWRQHEWRWKTGQLKGLELKTDAALWLGTEDISGKGILLWAEQGFGDAIQFLRYVPLVEQRAGRVILRVPSALRELAETIGGQVVIIENKDPLPPHDLHCPLMSLPLAFRTSLESIPAQVPYLRADPVRAANWSDMLGPRAKPRIGLVWAGRRQEPVNRTRDMQLDAFRGLAKLEVDLISLQKEIPGEDRRTAESIPQLLRLGEELADFADTAALIENLDLVISVDTAVAHLAGALGKPVWIMLRRTGEWRWLLDRCDSPWYPTARLFRQKTHGDWAGVIDEITRELIRSFH